MAIIDINKEEEQEEAKPRKGLLLGFDGGKADGEWLSKYPVGTEFLTELKKTQVLPDGRVIPKGPDLQAWQIIHKSRRGVRLAHELDNQQTLLRWVNPVLFCLNFELFEILTLGEEDGLQETT